MPEKLPEDLTPEALEERQRVLRLMESCREIFLQASCEHLFDRLFNRIQLGADPSDPEYEKNWLIP